MKIIADSALGAAHASGRPCDPLTPSAALHLIVIGGLDPDNAETWSGTPKSIVDALREQNHRVSTVGPLQKLETGWPRIKKCWHGWCGKTYLPIRDPAVVRRRMAALTAALRALQPYDAVIAWHAADAAIARATAPLIFVHDATWLRLLDFYPHYERRHLTQSTIASGEILDRNALANCAHAVYSSHWASQSAQEDYGTPAAKLSVHPFGANLPLIPTDDMLRGAIEERGHGPCRLLFIGSDWQRKGGDTAITVARRLNERGIACELNVVGQKPTANLPDYVRSHGSLSHKNPQDMAKRAALLTQADFLILPSRADCTPIVLSEAAAYGLPIATSAVGGIPETIGDSGWSKAFPPGTQGDCFVDWMEQAYRDRAHYQRMALLGRREYERRLNWQSFVQALSGTIRELQTKAEATRAPAELPT